MADTISRRKRNTIAIALVAGLALAGSGVALAYWTSSGSGSGTATTGESADFGIVVDEAMGELAPGGPGQTVGFEVQNEEETAQYLTAVEVTLADEDGVEWVPTGDCQIEDYSVTITTPPAFGNIAGGSSVTGTATVVLENTPVNQDDCQGQEVPLYFVAS